MEKDRINTGNIELKESNNEGKELDCALKSVLSVVRGRRGSGNSSSSDKRWGEEKRNTGSKEISAGKILPGASSLQDINKLLNAAKKEKMEQLKKKMSNQKFY